MMHPSLGSGVLCFFEEDLQWRLRRFGFVSPTTP